MPETVPACPLCGSPNWKPFDRRNFRGQVINNQLCTQCGLVYQSPRMTAGESAVFYETEYRQMYQGSQGPNAKDLAIQRGRAQSLLTFAQRQAKRVQRHLDIGCSAGLLLQAFAAEFRCRPVGIEPGQAYREYARGNGLNVYETQEALQAAGERRFDLISLAHVLEHLPDPLSYLAGLRRDLLTPEGFLLVEVPNLYSHDCFEVAHLVSYSAQTLLETIRLAGYDPLELKLHGLPRSDRLPLYLTMLASPAPDPQAGPRKPIPESGVQRKRRLGLLYRYLLTRFAPHQAWRPVES